MAKVSLLADKSETVFQIHSGYISLRDEPRPGHSSDLSQDTLRELEECNPRRSTRELGLDLHTFQSTTTTTTNWKSVYDKGNIMCLYDNARLYSVIITREKYGIGQFLSGYLWPAELQCCLLVWVRFVVLVSSLDQWQPFLSAQHSCAV